MRLVDFFGCIGCNNAALSRELKANAHLFGYLFAERHVSLRLFEAEGKAVAYPIRENEVDNIWCNCSTVRVADRSQTLIQSKFSISVGRRTERASAYSAAIPTPTSSCSRNPTIKLNAYDLPGAPQKLHQAIFNQCDNVTGGRKKNSPGTGPVRFSIAPWVSFFSSRSARRWSPIIIPGLFH